MRASKVGRKIEEPNEGISLARTQLRIVAGGVVQLEGYIENVIENLPSLSTSADSANEVHEELSLAVPLINSLNLNFKLLDETTQKIHISAESERTQVKELLDEALGLSIRLNEALAVYSKAVRALDELAHGKLH